MPLVAPVQKDVTIFISKAMKSDHTKNSPLSIEPDTDIDQFLGETDDLIEVDSKGIITSMFEK